MHVLRVNHCFCSFGHLLTGRPLPSRRRLQQWPSLLSSTGPVFIPDFFNIPVNGRCCPPAPLLLDFLGSRSLFPFRTSAVISVTSPQVSCDPTASSRKPHPQTHARDPRSRSPWCSPPSILWPLRPPAHPHLPNPRVLSTLTLSAFTTPACSRNRPGPFVFSPS